MAVSMRKQVAQNKRNTIIVMILFVAFIALVGAAFSWLVGDWQMLIWFTVIALGYALFQYLLADKIALKSSGAREIDEMDNPRLYKIVKQLAEDAKLPMPKVHIIADSAPNAFATGRDPQHASVAATTGLLEVMDDRELRAVMAHEMSHVRNYDIRVSMIVFGLVSIIGLISDFGLRVLLYGGSDRDNDSRSPIGALIVIVTIIISPIVATLVQLAISRQREYLADASAADLMGEPDAMIDALHSLDQHSRPMRQQNVASEAMYIANPLKKSLLKTIFSTHPPIESRIERLEKAKK